MYSCSSILYSCVLAFLFISCSSQTISKKSKASAKPVSKSKKGKPHVPTYGGYRFISPQASNWGIPPVFHKMRGKFLITDIKTLTRGDGPSIIRSWLNEDQSQRTVSIEIFSNLGIRSGQIVQYVNFETNTVHSYKFKDKINIEMIEAEVGDDKYGEIQILLDDSFDDHNRNDVSFDSGEGIAYNGNDFKLKASKMDEIKFLPSEKPSVLNLFKAYQEFTKDKSILNGAFEAMAMNKQIFGYSVNNPQEKDNSSTYTAEGAAVKINDKAVLLLASPWQGGDYAHPEKNFKYGNFIEGADMTIIQEGSSMNECESVYILKGEDVTMYRLQCVSGGC